MKKILEQIICNSRSHTFTPIAIAVFILTSSPNLKDPILLSLIKINGTFLEEAKPGRCFVSPLGLQSAANRTAYIDKKDLLSSLLKSDYLRKVE